MSHSQEMRRTLEQILLLLETKRSKLAIFKQTRPTAVLALLSVFEVAVLDLFYYDTSYSNVNPAADLTPMSKRLQLENAVCGLVSCAWAKSLPVQEYPRLDRDIIRMAIEAYHYQVMKDEVELAIGGTRLDLSSVRRIGNTIRFEGLRGFMQRQTQSLIKELTWESEDIRRELKEIPSPYTRPRSVGPIEVWTERLYHHAAELGLDVDTRIGKYTVKQYAKLWGALTHVSWQRFMRTSHAAKTRPPSIDPNLSVQLISRSDLVSDVETLSDLDKEVVEVILQDLTYDGSSAGDWLFVKPIVPLNGDLVVLPPAILINNNVFRNLRQRLVVENSKSYSVLTNDLSERMVGNIVEILNRNGYTTREKKAVRGGRADIETDIDIVAKKGNTIVVLQIKNINPPDTWKQNENAIKEILKGLDQLRKSVFYVRSHLNDVSRWFGKGEVLEPQRVEIRDYLITGLRPLITWSLSSVAESEKITDVMRFEDVLNLPKGTIRGSSPMRKLPQVVLAGKVGEFRIEIEAVRLIPGVGQVIDLERLWPFDELLDYLKV